MYVVFVSSWRSSDTLLRIWTTTDEAYFARLSSPLTPCCHGQRFAFHFFKINSQYKLPGSVFTELPWLIYRSLASQCKVYQVILGYGLHWLDVSVYSVYRRQLYGTFCHQTSVTTVCHWTLLNYKSHLSQMNPCSVLCHALLLYKVGSSVWSTCDGCHLN